MSSNQLDHFVAIDDRILNSGIVLGCWEMSCILLKNNAHFPWLILVPMVENIQSMDQLSPEQSQILMHEIRSASQIMRDYFKPDRLNVGALGNIVPQMHIHIIARYESDDLWPQGIWQNALKEKPYEEAELTRLIMDLTARIKESESRLKIM